MTAPDCAAASPACASAASATAQAKAMAHSDGQGVAGRSADLVDTLGSEGVSGRVMKQVFGGFL